MTLVTSSRNSDNFVQKRGKASVCGGVPTSSVNSSSFHSDDETVTSYRGKPTFVTVCGKSRKSFHSFRRYKRSLGGLEQMQWCCDSGRRYSTTKAYMLWLSHIYYPSGYSWPLSHIPNATRGEIDPFINDESMAVLGNELRDFVIRDLYVKANAPAFDGAVFFAELEETLTELRRILLGAANSLRRPGMGLSKLRHILLSPEEMWLWFRYFLMPAMMDAENLIALTKGVRRIDRVQDGDRSDGYKYMSGTYDLYQPYYRAWHPCNWNAKYKYGLGGAIDMYKRFDPHPWGFSNWDVLRATWERIPWSFVFDWFVNVGDWLASLRDIEIDYAQSYATFAIEAEVEYDYPNWYDEGKKFTSKVFLMDRIVDLELPTVPLVDKRWANCLRIIDSISLLVGTLKRVLTRRK